MRLQRAWTMPPYPQGAAALYPGLCASALTARAGQCIFCEQVVRVNQEQSHFGYNKLDTLIIRIFNFCTSNWTSYQFLYIKLYTLYSKLLVLWLPSAAVCRIFPSFVFRSLIVVVEVGIEGLSSFWLLPPLSILSLLLPVIFYVRLGHALVQLFY